jgi:hypothetical protein
VGAEEEASSPSPTIREIRAKYFASVSPATSKS